MCSGSDYNYCKDIKSVEYININIHFNTYVICIGAYTVLYVSIFFVYQYTKSPINEYMWSICTVYVYVCKFLNLHF